MPWKRCLDVFKLEYEFRFTLLVESFSLSVRLLLNRRSNISKSFFNKTAHSVTKNGCKCNLHVIITLQWLFKMFFRFVRKFRNSSCLLRTKPKPKACKRKQRILDYHPLRTVFSCNCGKLREGTANFALPVIINGPFLFSQSGSNWTTCYKTNKLLLRRVLSPIWQCQKQPTFGFSFSFEC